MTSVTNKVISEVYKIPQDDYNFQLMYMPMDTGIFYNDFFWEVIGAMLPIVYLSIVKLSLSTISTIGDVNHESIIQSTLKRAGMRKSVELYVHGILTLVICLVLFPPVIYMSVEFVIYNSISYGYFFLIITIFVLNSIAQYHMVMFALPEKWSGKVNKVLDLVAIVFMIQSIVLRKTVRWYVYLTSILPLDFVSWYVRFGMRAYNRNI